MREATSTEERFNGPASELGRDRAAANAPAVHQPDKGMVHTGGPHHTSPTKT